MKKARWLLPILLAVPLFAVTPSFWEVRTYEDFQKGKLTNLSLTSDDRLILAPRYDMIFDTQQTLILSTVADSKGNVYLGTGHDGKIYKVDPSGQGGLIADLNELDILALAVDSKDALYAAGSPNGKVYKIEPGGMPKEFFDPGARYIWSLVFDNQGRLLVGTGDKGVIYRVGTDGKGVPFYDTDETHIVSLAVDRDGSVLAGGDPKGYLYRISPEGKAFVLYDSGLREVHSIALGSDGRILMAVLNGDASSPSLPTLRPSSPSGPPTVNGGGVTITIGESASPAPQPAAQAIEIATDTAGLDTTPSPGSQSHRARETGPAQSVILEVLSKGEVNTLWRLKDETVYSLLPHNGKLLFSTGTKGRIYSIDDSRNTTLLVESTEEQTTRLIEVGNRVYATSSNAGKLFGLSDATAASGTYESAVHDTNAVSTWGTMSWKAENPAQIQFLTRSGNTGVPDKTWSDWMPVASSGVVASPAARFAQWKAILTSGAGTYRVSPSLDSVTLPYLQQNFRPEVTSVDVLPPGVALARVPPTLSSGSPAPTDPALIRANIRAGLQSSGKMPPRRSVEKGAQSFQWSATDRNQDALTYDVYYRGESERTWKLLKKGLDDNFYTINSDALPDGTYVLRVVASDSPSNPPSSALTAELESRPFVIDNTPPVVRIQQSAIAGGRVSVAIDAADATSTLNQSEISVDTGPWQAVFPVDGITDSKTERYTYQSDVLTSGEHVIAFRTYDQNDNVGIGKLVVRIP
jgi:sugar lactone lactonase YvrE